MSRYQSSLEWVRNQQQAMLEQTVHWSRINSGSTNLEGLDRMCAALQSAFAPLGGEAEEITLAPRELVTERGEVAQSALGKALRIRKHTHAPVHVFLGGHMDTVFASDHAFQEPTQLDAYTLQGPGVADLKGGLVVMLTALMVLERSEFAGKVGWEMLINPDEEIGSPGSDGLLQEAAGRNDIGLIFEPSFADGTLASIRKGSGNFVAVMRGRAAHVGRSFFEGRNAVAALGELIVDLTALTGIRPGILCNVGKIEGGGPVNQVPDLAILRFNIRVDSAEEQAFAEARLQELHRKFNARDGLSLSMHGRFGRPPKQWNELQAHLLSLLESCAAPLGLTLPTTPTGGCCDGNNLAAYGLPNIDTLGVRGGNLHTDREFMMIESLSERAQLSALLLLKLASGEAVWPYRGNRS